MRAAHSQFGTEIGPNEAAESCKIRAYADSCCQTCTAGTDFLSSINFPPKALIQTTHKIIGITVTKLGIIGAILLKITANNRTTRQMVYISNNVKGMFLSRGALEDLGVISKSFPLPPQHSQVNACIEEGNAPPGKPGTCQCPNREPTPEVPDTLPFPATEENIPKLEQWLLTTFGSSAFNTCEE